MTSRDPASGTRRTGWAVLLAAALLAVIGASVGHLLGRTARAEARTDPSARPSVGSPAATGDPSVPHDDRPGCPDATQKAVEGAGAAGKLQLVLYVETKQSEIWICRSGDSRLWYQGHRKSAPDARYPGEQLVAGTNALLLPNVNAITQGRYVAANDETGKTTTYTVSRRELLITFSDGRQESQAVTRAAP